VRGFTEWKGEKMRESEENPIFEWSCSDLEKIDTKWD